MNFLILLATFLFISGCASLNQQSYDTLMSLPPKVDDLEKRLAAMDGAASKSNKHADAALAPSSNNIHPNSSDAVQAETAQPVMAQKTVTAQKATVQTLTLQPLTLQPLTVHTLTPQELTVQALTAQMQSEIDQESVKVKTLSARSVQITMQHQILFSSGSTSVSDQGKNFLKKFTLVAENLPDDAKIRIVGHSDNRQLGWKKRQIFSDNVGLSQARADNVKNVLLKQSTINPSILFSEGHGASEPIGNNGTRDGRALNRRIEIFVENI